MEISTTKKILFLDVETQTPVSWKKGERLEELRISYLGAINYATGEEIDIWEKDEDFEKLAKLMQKADVIAGYNIVGFDMPVISRYLGEEVKKYPMLDLMLGASSSIGFWPKLDDLAMASLNRSKTGNGLDAVRYFAEGKLQKLRDYCMEDVRLTKELYDFGLKEGKIKYYDKRGFLKESQIDWNQGLRNTEKIFDKKARNEKLTMF